MDHSKEIGEESNQNNPLLGLLAIGHPFRVPEEYFALLPGQVLSTIKVECSLPEKTNVPYQIPAAYFSSLADNILAGVHTLSSETDDELGSIAPVLSRMDKNATYRIAESYFAENPDLLVAAVQKNQPAKLAVVKSLRRWMQYAAAAMVGGILVTGAFIYTDSKSYLKQYKMLKSSSDSVPASAQQATTPTQEQPAVSEETMQEEETTKQSAKPNEEIRFRDFAKKIQLLSDEELNKYLEENAVPETVSLLNDASEI